MIKADIVKSECTYDTVQELLRRNSYVGYRNEDGDRYMMPVGGPGMGSAVRPEGTWAAIQQQEEYTDGYFIFPTKNELLDWMKE